MPSSYCDADIFERELSDVFARHWQFVCFADQLASPNDFVTTTIGKTPVVVQNIQGHIYALHNVCSHRKATIQTVKHGNRPLRCPYHCWSYGANGKLGSVPQDKQNFQFDDATREALALKSFEVSQAGDFVFVRITPSTTSLADDLGPYFSLLETLSEGFGAVEDTDTLPWQSNWKLAVESVLEVYHVHGVHPESFAKLAKPSFNMSTAGQHNTGISPLQAAPKKWWKGVRKLLSLDHVTDFDEYTHLFIYPNLAIGITDGSLMSVQTYEPVSPTQCQLHYSLRMCRADKAAKQNAQVRHSIVENFTTFNTQTLDEDRVVVETCQSNMQHTDTPGWLGACESRIAHFHQSWRTDMEFSHD
jgi:phenylpropionate dioxygenase-like ring-hydroxylating dioxygenase large terminal subunit